MATPLAWPPTINLYEILDLPSPWTGIACSAEDIKAGYRRALFKHHPDKAASLGVRGAETAVDASGRRDEETRLSVDDITLARSVLLDPVQRREYDRHLQLRAAGNQVGLARAPTGTGLEVVDLEEMHFSEARNGYVRGCRCGNEVGFQVTEDELEKEAEHGEIMVSCPGCSLTVRILFQVELDHAAS